MKSIKEWVSALQIPTSTYQDWVNTLPKNESLTFWCLLTGKIKAEDYLIWAREHFQLAFLKTEFFKKSPNFSFWNQIKPVANWSAQMIPLQEWDGVIFVGCVEPHHEVQWSFPVQYILASAVDLANYWKALNTVEQSVPVPVPSAASVDQPAGLNLAKFANITAPKSVDLMEELARKIEATTKNVDLNMPDNLNWNPAPASSDDINSPEGMSFTAPIIKPSTIPAAVAPPPPANINSYFIQIINEMKSYFSAAMIFGILNESAVAETWDGIFKPTTEAATKPWSLNTPSALRIAFRTKQPYLGHIVDTPINKEIFNSWGFSELPKNILIQPIINGNQVTHLVLATVDDGKKSHQTLHEGNLLAEKFSQSISLNRVA